VLITKFCVDIYCKLVLRHNWLSSTFQNAAPPVEALRKAVMAVVRVWTYDIVVNNNYTCLGVARGPRVSPQMRCVLFAYMHSTTTPYNVPTLPPYETVTTISVILRLKIRHECISLYVIQ